MLSKAVLSNRLSSGLRYTSFAVVLLILLSLLLLPSCGSIGTIKDHLRNPDFAFKNAPRREIRVCLMTDGTRTDEEINSLFSSVNEMLQEQVGMDLIVVEKGSLIWSSRDMVKMIQQLHSETKNFSQCELFVGVTSPTPIEAISFNLIGDWQGVIDDTYRRHIIVKYSDPRVLLHEVFHAFILNHEHSDFGIMQASLFYLLPGMPVNYSLYLSEQDYNEVLKNKWRTFGIPVSAASEHILVAK